MVVNTSIIDIVERALVLSETFIDNSQQWEEVINPGEGAKINQEERHYLMYNKTNSRWNHYTIEAPISISDDFALSVSFRNNPFFKLKAFGWMWGYMKNSNRFNRFEINPSSQSFRIVNFERNHGRIPFEHFEESSNLMVGGDVQNELGIVKLCGVYYFFINNNDVPVFQCSENLLPMNGNLMGIYVEPGSVVTSEKIKLYKLKSHEIKENNFYKIFE